MQIEYLTEEILKFDLFKWQDCYPERLGKLFIVHVPYLFMTAWKVVYPFIDNKTKKKVLLEISFLQDMMCILRTWIVD